MMEIMNITRTFLIFACSALVAPAALAGSAPAGDAAAAPSSLGESASVAALPDDQVPAEVKILRRIEKELKEKYKKEIFTVSNIPSLVFPPGQHALLSEARVGFNTRAPTQEEMGEVPTPDDPNYRPPPSVRVLSLGGIVFNTPDEWTIYLNQKRVTPDALPKEAVDLRVYKDFIELRWFDVQTNQIFPIRLRPNQKFNLDGRIFLPG
jgi:hypothetical protein